VDREVVISFESEGVKAAARLEAGHGVDLAAQSLARRHRWAVREKRFGDELDLLAVDERGRLLAVEVKHGKDTAGVAWTPAQAAVYLSLVRSWADASANVVEILDGMLAQQEAIGLPRGPSFRPSSPLTVVPVIAVSRPLKNPREANTRMLQARTALADQGILLEDLQLWGVGLDGTVEERPFGAL
jgi:hypothetical protein